MEGLLDGYLTRNEIAKALDVTPRTISRWQKANPPLPYFHIGGRVYFKKATVIEWIDAHETVRA